MTRPSKEKQEKKSNKENTISDTSSDNQDFFHASTVVIYGFSQQRDGSNALSAS